MFYVIPEKQLFYRIQKSANAQDNHFLLVKLEFDSAIRSVPRDRIVTAVPSTFTLGWPIDFILSVKPSFETSKGLVDAKRKILQLIKKWQRRKSLGPDAIEVQISDDFILLGSDGIREPTKICIIV